MKPDTHKKKLTASMEDYLKTIVILSQKNSIVTVKELALKMRCKKPSVTSALKKLKKLGLIEHEKYGSIELTPKGKKTGQQICTKFNCLSKFFNQILMIELSEARLIACKMEHCINREVKRRINNFLLFYEHEKKLNSEWVKRQRQHLLKNKF